MGDITIEEALAVALLAALVVAALWDLRERVIPNACSATVVAARAVVVLRAMAAGRVGNALASLGSSVAGAAALLACLALVAGLVGRGGKGRPVGGGDVKLLCALALALGPLRGAAVAALACALALAGRLVRVVAAALRDARLPGQDGMPLAPAILVATLIVVSVPLG